MTTRYVPLLIVAALLMHGCGSDNDGSRIVGELASDRLELTAEVGEPIIEILVAEGESVTAGQVLIVQLHGSPRRRRHSARHRRDWMNSCADHAANK
jgi:hypothetical protein